MRAKGFPSLAARSLKGPASPGAAGLRANVGKATQDRTLRSTPPGSRNGGLRAITAAKRSGLGPPRAPTRSLLAPSHGSEAAAYSS